MPDNANPKNSAPRLRQLSLTLIICLFLFALCACSVTSSALRLVPAEPPLTSDQRYRLLLYGGLDSNDFEAVAVLDRLDDRFLLISHTKTINVRLLEEVTIAEALAETKVFLGRNNYFAGMETKAIIGPDGLEIGYEIRARHSPLAGRMGDDLDTTYLPGPDDTVIFYVYYPPQSNGGPDDPIILGK